MCAQIRQAGKSDGGLHVVFFLFVATRQRRVTA